MDVAITFWAFTGPAVAGLVLALICWIVSLRRTVPLMRGVRGWSAVAAGIALVLIVAYDVMYPITVAWQLQSDANRWWYDNRHLYSLLAGLLGVAVLSLPRIKRASPGKAELRRRAVTEFGARWWFVVSGGLTAVATLIALVGGAMSSPDAEGRYRIFEIPLDDGQSSTPETYGWFFSIPCLVALVALCVTAIAVLASVARPPLSVDQREVDLATRRRRTFLVLAMMSGAVLINIGVATATLSGVATIHDLTMSGSVGRSPIGAPWSGLASTLSVVSTVTMVGGHALWFWILFSSIPIRVRAQHRELSAAR